MLALWPATSHGEPYMALREGFACGDCHTNRTGGGMRNLTAEMHAGQILRLPRDGQGILPEVDERFSPNINRYLSVGTDFRVVDRLLFQDNPDANGRVENNTAFRQVDSNDIRVDEANLYADVRLVPDYLSFYVDERVAPGGAENREVFGLLDKVLPLGAYLKAGQFFAPWGLKTQDDDSYVNSVPGFSFDRNVAGAEVGRSGDGLNWFFSVADGADDSDTDPLLIANSYYSWHSAGLLSGALLGGSAAYETPGSNEFGAYTVYAGLGLGNWQWLAQGAFVDTEITGDKNRSWMGYGEANYLLFGWLNAKFVFDWLDPDDGQGDDVQNRLSFGLEPFLDQFLQVRLFYRVLNGPENQANLNRDTLTLEAHLFF